MKREERGGENRHHIVEKRKRFSLIIFDQRSLQPRAGFEKGKCPLIVADVVVGFAERIV